MLAMSRAACMAAPGSSAVDERTSSARGSPGRRGRCGKMPGGKPDRKMLLQAGGCFGG